MALPLQEKEREDYREAAGLGAEMELAREALDEEARGQPDAQA